ncbi:MAG: beta-ketoacyl-ACP reductase [Saprospiraceae bacterium]|nr:beta-ketoacyl-ACP reductase [Saprospiraceae bacterium]
MTNRLSGRTAVVTGGASGIGRATVLRFLQEGARVAIWDVQTDRGRALEAECQAQGWPARFFEVNTTDAAAVHEAARLTHEAFGSLDILVNNAGITRDSTLKKMSPEQWDLVIAVNLTGVFHCTHAAYPYMEAGGWGRVLTAASVVGLYGNFGQTNYAATKGGVIAMTKVWAKEFGRKGITANAVAPGFIRTEMTDMLPENVLKTMQEKAPANRLGTVEEVAAAYAFLASDEAAFINGAVLSVDGGLTL